MVSHTHTHQHKCMQAIMEAHICNKSQPQLYTESLYACTQIETHNSFRAMKERILISNALL